MLRQVIHGRAVHFLTCLIELVLKVFGKTPGGIAFRTHQNHGISCFDAGAFIQTYG